MIRIVLTYPEVVQDEINRIQILMEDDFDILHLRKPDFSLEMMRGFVEQLPDDIQERTVIHSHFSLVHNYDLKGIHLNSKDRNQLFDVEDTGSCEIQTLIRSGDEIWVNRRPVNHVSYSAHSVKEINELNFKVDYAFLSPVYNSISKLDYPSAFEDKEQLRDELAFCQSKVVALGGVDNEKIEQLGEIGFAGYAMLGAIWNNEIEV